MEQKHKGHDTLGAIGSILGREIDPRQVQVFNLTFTERCTADRCVQKFSVLDTEGGVMVYPLLTRFSPASGKSYRCYTVFRNNKQGVKIGYALPLSLHKLTSEEWRPVTNNIAILTFRKQEGEGGGKFVAVTETGKLAVVFDSEFVPAVGQPVRSLVSERLSCFIVHGEVPEETGGFVSATALARVCEAAGAIIEAIDPFMVLHGQLNYDAAEVLKVERKASRQAIKQAYQRLSQEAHPDKKRGEYRRVMGSDPDQDTEAEFQDDFQLLQRCRERMLLQCTRREASQKYGPRGQDFSRGIEVNKLAKQLQRSPSEVMEALKEIGYEVAGNKAEIKPEAAKTISGWFAVKTRKEAARAANSPPDPEPTPPANANPLDQAAAA